MCGFFGIYQTDHKASIEKQSIDKALNEIEHRGPDEKSIWLHQERRAGLGHTRLSIIGLDNGVQPISAENGDLQIVVNGEFYGYEAIRNELRQKGYRFTTQSDSEIALHLYRESGVAGLERLRGEFSLVLYDATRNTMLLMRDRVGIKPLYYGEHNGLFYVASEIKSILAAGYPAVWDMESYTSRAFYLQDRTLFQGIRSVKPGYYVTVSSAGVSHIQYWDVEYATKKELKEDQRDAATCIRQLHDLVLESVSLRLRSDVPVGVYLSGGIDSSAMLGMANSLSDKPLESFNLSFTDLKGYDENSFAKLAAKKSNSKLNTIQVTQDTLADNFAKALWHNEIPFFNAHGVAKYILSGALKDAGYKVTITGEGADEIFAGYPHFRRDMVLYNSENQDPDVIDSQKSIFKYKENIYTHNGLPDDVHWLSSAVGRNISWVDNQASWFYEIQKMYNQNTQNKFGKAYPYWQFWNVVDHRRLKDLDPVHESMYLWSKSYLPNFVTTTLGDRMEMANSIEGRVPLLDHKLVEFSAKTPVNLKIKGATEKYIFREAVRSYVPNELYTRKKHYFRAPPSTLFQGGRLYELVQDTLRGQELKKLPFFDADRVIEILDDLPGLSEEQQAMLDPMIMEITSLCILQARFNIQAPQ